MFFFLLIENFQDIFIQSTTRDIHLLFRLDIIQLIIFSIINILTIDIIMQIEPFYWITTLLYVYLQLLPLMPKRDDING